jgi:ribonuclease G
MSNRIFLSRSGRENRLALLEEGRLVEFQVERILHERVAGNIYKGRVRDVLPGMQAAFVDIGLEKNAFLYVDDCLPPCREGASLDPGGEEKPRITDILHVGQEMLVQVVKEPTGTKGPRVTTHLTLPGRFLVLTPYAGYVGVSRRIENETERERLRLLASEVTDGECGIIVRTAAEGVGALSLREDYLFLKGLWQRIVKVGRTIRAPGIVFRDLDLLARSVRDLFTEEIDEFVVDSAEYAESIRDIVKYASPHLAERITLYQGETDLFEAYRIEPEIEKAYRRKVWLRNGAYIVIDQTEALTAIDVNTGKFVGTTTLEDTVLKTNLEAAREIARQIRLRDIGGIIVIDFIDMMDPEHQTAVLEELQRCLKKDRTRTHVVGLTRLGLVEMTRKKVHQSLEEQFLKPCRYCEGTGKMVSEDSLAARIERVLERHAKHHTGEAVLIEVHPSVASLLIGPGGQNLARLEKRFHTRVHVRGKDSLPVQEFHLTAIRAEGRELHATPVEAGQILQLYIEEPHAHNPADGIARVEGYVIDVEQGGMFVGQTIPVCISRVYRTYAKAVPVPSGRNNPEIHRRSD